MRCKDTLYEKQHYPSIFAVLLNRSQLLQENTLFHEKILSLRVYLISNGFMVQWSKREVAYFSAVLR